MQIAVSSPNSSLDRFILPPGAFRLLLAYMVFLTHTLPLHIGALAVYLFFSLSGYWIYRMWHGTYSKTQRPYATFLISRVWRLMPMYFLAIVVLVATILCFPDHAPEIPTWPSWPAFHYYLSHAILLGYSQISQEIALLPAAWSLDIEFQFYLIAPFIILWLDRGTPAVRATVLSLIGMIGLVAFLLYFTSTTGQSAYLPNYSLFFFAGLITSRFTWKPDTRLALLLVGVAFGLMVMCILIPFTRSLFMTGRFTGSLSEYNMHANVVMALLCLPYAMATVEHRLVDKHAQTIDRHLANITYIVYLIHRIAIYLLDTFAGGLTHVHQLPWIAASWIAVFIIALVIYRLVDRPIDARRHKFVEARQLVHSNVNLQG